MESHAEDISFPAPEPSREDVFRGIARLLGNAMNDNLTQLELARSEANAGDFRLSHAMQNVPIPLSMIADGTATSFAPKIKKNLDSVLEQFESLATVGNAPDALRQANEAPGFWDWVAQQTPRRAQAEHPRIASGAVGDSGRGGR